MTHRIAATLTLSLALTSGLTLIAGCQHVNAPIQGRSDPFAPPPQVTFSSTALRNQTAVGPLAVDRDDAGNLLHVTVPLRSAVAKTLYVDYRVTFVDRNGSTLTQTGWMPKMLEANTPGTIQANSTSDQAVDFLIAIRPAR